MFKTVHVRMNGERRRKNGNVCFTVIDITYNLLSLSKEKDDKHQKLGFLKTKEKTRPKEKEIKNKMMLKFTKTGTENKKHIFFYTRVCCECKEEKKK